jgi:sodium/potassium-transporting ATPase subunit alpha
MVNGKPQPKNAEH